MPSELDTLLDPVAYLGTSNRRRWIGKSIGVGGFDTFLPAAPSKVQCPLEDNFGRFVMAADVRLDGREDLMHALAYPYERRPTATDEDLLLAAYLRWGTDCCLHLLGDFCFLVVDRRSNTIYGASDATGARRLFLAELASGSCVIASEEGCLVALPELSSHWCEVAVAFWMMASPHRELSLFERIRVVACGQYFSKTAKAVHFGRWWSPTALRPIRYRSLDEYAEHYRELLTYAVADRLGRNNEPVLCELSGGLDSSTVTATAVALGAAKSRRVAALSYLYPDYPGCDESRAITEIRDQLALASWHGEDGARFQTLSPWDGYRPRPESPGTFLLMAQEHAIEHAIKLGCSVLLTGLGGDEHTAGNPGFAVLARLAERDMSVFLELLEISRRRGVSLAGLLKNRVLKPALKTFLPGRLTRRVECQRMVTGNLPPWLMRDKGLVRRIAEQCVSDACIGELDPYPRSMLLRLRHNSTWVGLDAYRSSGRARGVKVQAPLFDLRITNFMLASPAHLWCRDGYNKHLVRQAFRGKLPQSVLWLRDKVYYHQAADHRWALHGSALVREFDRIRTNGESSRQLAKMLPRADENLETGNRFSIIYAACLARWLNSRSLG